MNQGEEFDLPSGAKLFVSISPYEQVMALHDALANEMRGKGLGALDVVEVQKVLRKEGEAGLNIIVDKVLAMAASREIKDAVFACAAKAVYRPHGTVESSIPVTRTLFDNGKLDLEKVRGDFYAIAARIIEVNLRPFAKALFSLYLAHVGKSADTQESKSEKEPLKPS